MASALKLASVIGFGGDVVDGLLVHPDGEHVIYPLGSTIVVRRRDDPSDQRFLRGHNDKVSCLALSNSGKYLASGQQTYMGFTAPIIVWDLETLEIVHRLSLHKVKVQSLTFSCDDQFLASLGGHDDNALVLWDVVSGEALCGSPTSNDFTLTVRFFNNDPKRLMTAGNYSCKVWEYLEDVNKVRPTEVHIGSLSRVFNTITIDDKDEFAYVGSSSGDFVQVSLANANMRGVGPGNGLVKKGITCSAATPNGLLLLGGGSGTLSVVDHRNVARGKIVAASQRAIAPDAVTSLSVDWASFDGRRYLAFAGTEGCEMYRIVMEETQVVMAELVQTAHPGPITGLAFPYEYGEVFATCDIGTIRVWHLESCRELLRIRVPNLECKCVCLTDDGSALVSGWSDGRIRAFGPQTGKLLWVINDAHHKGVTAIACSSDSTRLVTGGAEGLVRVWALGHDSQVMLASMKEHKGPVNALAMRNSSDTECVSAASDGSCVVWDLEHMHRRLALQANTFFKSVAYHPDDSQLVTCGSDRKITFWDAYDGQPIRIIDGSDDAEMSSLATDADGAILVTGGHDKTVSVWGYDDGLCHNRGLGHSGEVSRVLVSPDRTRIVSVGTEGGIFIWEVPHIETS
ncbi:unnamed protein product [Pedinophyceae sp. YPF-701]|nr:unnamed protein product [Pedinophyceae sp. YPF-701]